MSNKVQNMPRGLSHDGLSLTLQERLWRAPHHGCGRSVAIAGFKFTLTARLYRGMLWGIAGLFIVLFTASALAAPAENRDDLLKLPESLSGAEPSPKIPPSEVLITTADDILGEMVNLNR